MTLTTLLLFGFLLGMKHATDADHLAAVATVASGHQSLAQTVRQGLAWGAGHTLTLLMLGGVVLALGKSIPAGLENALELAVACMLIALGVENVEQELVQGQKLEWQIVGINSGRWAVATDHYSGLVPSRDSTLGRRGTGTCRNRLGNVPSPSQAQAGSAHARLGTVVMQITLSQG